MQKCLKKKSLEYLGKIDLKLRDVKEIFIRFYDKTWHDDYEKNLLMLVCASKNPDIEAVKFIINKKMDDINHVDTWDSNALFYVCINSGDPDIVKILIDNKIKVNKFNYHQKNPLIYLCENSQNIKSMKLLIDAGCDVNFFIRGSISNALHVLCQHSPSIKAVQFLLTAQVDVNQIDYSGNNPLFNICAGKNPNPKIIKLLIKAGTRLKHSSSSRNALIVCYENSRNIEAMKTLIDLGINLNSYTSGRLLKYLFSMCKKVEIDNISGEGREEMKFILKHGITCEE